MTRASSLLLVLLFACVLISIPLVGLSKQTLSYLPSSSSDRTSVVAASTTSNSNYAIAYLIAGCDESSCIGYVLNILVAKAIIDSSNFGGDVMVLIRMASSSNFGLPQQAWLERARIRVKYLPISLKRDNFVLAQLDKFRILDLIEYKRVLYLDSDAIPLCNLDYIFEASLSGVVEEYVAMAQFASPTTGSIFLLTPREGEFGNMMDIVRSAVANRTSFDLVHGFGHRMIAESDYWKTLTPHQSGQKYTFYGAHCDQGLLYHWLKYVQKNFTLLFREMAETYGQVDAAHENAISVEDGTYVALVKKKKLDLQGCNAPRYGRAPWASFHLYRDHYHFGGKQKPWLVGGSASKTPIANYTTDPRELWWAWLHHAKSQWDIIELPDPLDLQLPSLGLFPKEDSLYGPDVEIPN